MFITTAFTVYNRYFIPNMHSSRPTIPRIIQNHSIKTYLHFIALIILMIIQPISAISQTQFNSQQQDERHPDYIDPKDIQQFPDGYQYEIYGGYLNITDFDKSFYYMLFKSQNQNDNDPLILWLNGGPGCSSMIGFTSENGPFLFTPQTDKMQINPYAWNKNAHVMYLQSPAGVGFSKGKQSSLNASDSSVAKDNYLALLKFFQKFPQLTDKDFWIAGQSYAGIYIPTLAQQIIQNNQQQSGQDRKINLKGIIVGNGCTHPYQCYTNAYVSRYQVEFLYTRGFVDYTDYSEYVSTCIVTDNQKLESCINIQRKIKTAFDNSKANIYNIYGVCYPIPAKSYFFDDYVSKINKDSELSLSNLRHYLKCSDSVGPNSLFNSQKNRQILHVQSNQTLKWTPCSDIINYTIQPRAAFPIIRTLVQYGLQIHYYSGDFDGMVPIQGTIDWIRMYRNIYGASIKRSWRPWLVQQNIGGFIWQLDGFTFWSVVGAGHMVPTDKPKQSKYMLDVILGIQKLSTVDDSNFQQL